MALILKRPWTSQPQVAAGLRLPFKALFLGSTNRNLAPGRIGTPYRENTTFSPGPYGVAYYKAGGTSAAVELLKGGELPAQGCTVLYAGLAIGSDTAGHFGEGSATSGKRLGAHVPYGPDGNIYWDFGGTTDGATRLSVAGGVLSESDIWVFTTGARGMEVWKNGAKIASNGANPSRTVADGADDHWGLAPNGTWGPASAAQRCYAIGLLGYQVPTAIAVALSRSHASMYETALAPLSRRIWAPSAVVGTPVGIATETDTALTLAGRQLRTVGIAAESDTAIAPAGVQIRSAGLAVEADTAQTLPGRQMRQTGMATETDGALALVGAAPGGVGIAAETDSAPPLTGRQLRPAGQSVETNTALALGVVSARLAGLALEIDAAFALPAVQRRMAGRADEADQATALPPGLVAAPVGLAIEADLAYALAAGSSAVVEARTLRILAESRARLIPIDNRQLRVIQ